MAWGHMLRSEIAIRPTDDFGRCRPGRVRLIVWCKLCRHQSEPEPAGMTAHYGAETPVPEWKARLVCSSCGSRDVDMVATGAGR